MWRLESKMEEQTEELTSREDKLAQAAASENDTTTHVSEAKKQKVKELAELMKKKTVMVISVKGLPSAQFQDIKKKLRSRAKIQVVKKSLINFALDHSGIKELQDLVPYVSDSTAMLFSDSDAFELSGILANEKSPAKAKAGQIAPSDIEVKAGPTELLPGPDISALSAVGLIPKVENGKISVGQDKVIAKEGDVITEALASIMAKLDIIPFEVGVEPIAAFDNDEKKVYADIKIDKEAFMETMLSMYGRTLPFAVEIGYVNDTTIDFILSRAGMEGDAIEALITEETPAEEAKEESVAEEPKEEAVEEKPTEEKPAEEPAAEEEKKEEETNTDEVKADEAVTESQ